MVTEVDALRRTIIKGMSITVAGTSLSEYILQRSSSVYRFVGYTYDPVTHQVQRQATADLHKSDEGIWGKFALSGISINISKEQKVSNMINRGDFHKYTISSKEKQTSIPPLRIHISTDWEQLRGRMTRESPEFGQLAFSMIVRDHQKQKEQIRDEIDNIELGAGDPERLSPNDVEVPEKGVPKDNSIKSAIAKVREARK
jgi:hypothetical protein